MSVLCPSPWRSWLLRKRSNADLKGDGDVKNCRLITKKINTCPKPEWELRSSGSRPPSTEAGNPGPCPPPSLTHTHFNVVHFSCNQTAITSRHFMANLLPHAACLRDRETFIGTLSPAGREAPCQAAQNMEDILSTLYIYCVMKRSLTSCRVRSLSPCDFHKSGAVHVVTTSQLCSCLLGTLPFGHLIKAVKSS